MTDDQKALFQLFNEVAIINQLSSALFQARLPDGLHVSHFSVLNHLTRMGDGRTPLAIAKAFQVPKTTMTHTLAVLEKRGLIEMEKHATDGRSKVVRLTDAGRTAHGAAIGSMAAPLARLAHDLDDQDVLEILPALEKLRSYLDANRDI